MAADRQRAGKLWGGRFTEGTDPGAARFTASLGFDRRLWAQDITGSLAWAAALCRTGLLTEDERRAIADGLEAVRAEIESGRFTDRKSVV